MMSASDIELPTDDNVLDQPPRRPAARYIINVFLLALSSAGMAIYVRIHFEPSWSEQWAALLGSSVSLWTLLEAINSLALKLLGKGLHALLLQRIRVKLLMPSATVFLGGALTIILF